VRATQEGIRETLGAEIPDVVVVECELPELEGAVPREYLGQVRDPVVLQVVIGKKELLYRGALGEGPTELGQVLTMQEEAMKFKRLQS